MPLIIVFFAIIIWQGFDKIFGIIPNSLGKTGVTLRGTGFWQAASKTFPGTGKEFMPALDEGSFLLMPTTMPHSGIEENLETIKQLDMQVNAIPEVEQVVGKWGRVNSALDPAPISMYENVINYKPEYVLDEKGHRIRFKTNKEGAFILGDGSTYHPGVDEFRIIKKEELVPGNRGEYFRQWRDHIRSTDDIWQEIVKQSNIPGLTSAPKLQPIQTRLIMLQTGMRAPMGLKVRGPDLATLEKFGLQLEHYLKNVPGIEPASVFADRVVGKPYLEIELNREAIARYGLTIEDMQTYITGAIGGMSMTSTVEGRERFSVRVRYARELRDNPEDLKKVLIPTPSGPQVPLGELAEINYTRGPQLIRSENTFLTSYVIFDKKEGNAEVDVVEAGRDYLDHLIDKGELKIPAGVSYEFTGNYENQVRATKRLMIVIPVSLIMIFLLLYFQFRSVSTSTMIFTGIIVAFAGGFLMIWFYSQSWFMDISIAGMNMRDLFSIHTINLSVAVWVGFIALFGIATDDGVLVGTYLTQLFHHKKAGTREEIRAIVMEAGKKRVRPAMMTTATTLIALLPVLTSTGKGSDIMIPMAIPLFGGMVIEALTIFVVPVIYSWNKERKLEKTDHKFKGIKKNGHEKA